jgi:lysyl endopeptidase
MKPETFFGGLAVPIRRSMTAALLLVLAIPAHGKMTEEPRSFQLAQKSLAQIDRKVLPPVDNEKMLREDRQRGGKARRPEPERFAVAVEAGFTPENSGTWQDLPDGRLWRLVIQSPGAVSLNLAFTRFELAPGVKLWIYDPHLKRVEGSYTARDRSRRGRLFTPIIEGEEVVVELFVPQGAAAPALEIGTVQHAYRAFGKAGLFGHTAGDCEIDVICPEGAAWSNEIRAVGVYTRDGDHGCTGTLLNNTAIDFTPYVYSAHHCGVDASNDDTVVIYWNFQSPVCGDQGPGSLADNQSGAIFRASWETTDFLLFELDDQPDAAFNVFHAGWDATGTTPTSGVGIHHPRLDIKSISLTALAPFATNPDELLQSDTPSPTGNFWRTDWGSQGVTEGGSSGSCLFDPASHRCIGQLKGGQSGCGKPAEDQFDYYGRFSVSWEGGGTDATRLRNWLDPGNTGTTSLWGDPHVVTANGVRYDFQGAGEFVTLRDGADFEVQVRQKPVAVTFEPGPDAHTGLAVCPSLNSAVAAKVGNRRVSYQPNLSGRPDPSGLQLRVDGQLVSLGASGLDLGNGGRLRKTAAAGGLEIDFPDGSILFATPGYWDTQGEWFLNLDLRRPAGLGGAASGGGGTTGGGTGTPGAGTAGGLAGPITGTDWLPRLPSGASLGPKPATLAQRYQDLYGKFADAWRLTAATSLFDYAPGTSTETFTNRNWPQQNQACRIPGETPAEPLSLAAAQRACRPVKDPQDRRSCVFDVQVTGHRGFAETYVESQRVRAFTTRPQVVASRPATTGGEAVTFTATIESLGPGLGVARGKVCFYVDGRLVKKWVKLDENGQASFTTSKLAPGEHRVSVRYIPKWKTDHLGGSSVEVVHTVAP